MSKDRVAEYLEGVSRSEFYIRAAQRPPPMGKHSSELLLDYQFTKFFKLIETDILKIFRANSADFLLTNTPSSSEIIVSSYKKLIKQQDETIAQLMLEVKALKDEKQSDSLVSF